MVKAKKWTKKQLSKDLFEVDYFAGDVYVNMDVPKGLSKDAATAYVIQKVAYVNDLVLREKRRLK